MINLAEGNVKYWIIFPPFPSGHLCNVYPRLGGETQGLPVGRATTGIAARPNRSACSSATCSIPLPLCRQRQRFETKQNVKRPYFPQWLLLCNLLFQLISALRSAPVDYPISSLFYAHIRAHVLRLINPNRAFLLRFMQITRLAIVPEELVCVTWRRGGGRWCPSLS